MYFFWTHLIRKSIIPSSVIDSSLITNRDTSQANEGYTFFENSICYPANILNVALKFWLIFLFVSSIKVCMHIYPNAWKVSTVVSLCKKIYTIAAFSDSTHMQFLPSCKSSRLFQLYTDSWFFWEREFFVFLPFWL